MSEIHAAAPDDVMAQRVKWLVDAAVALDGALAAEDEARITWEDCGCGTPERERWADATADRYEATRKLRAAVHYALKALNAKARIDGVDVAEKQVRGGES